jgi:hypothetical protein
VDGLIITQFGYTDANIAKAVAKFGPDRVLVPRLLLKSIKREAAR